MPKRSHVLLGWGGAMDTYNPSSGKPEAGLLWVQGQPGLNTEKI